MLVCSHCQRELDEAARSAGVCPGCGGVVRALPQRTIADVRFPGEEAVDPELASQATIELPGGGDTAARLLDQETLASLELSQSLDGLDEESSQPRTVAFSAEQTVEFLGGSSAVDDSLLTSHWEGNIAGGPPSDSRATIKQKETISGSFMTSSSLIVKSRNVRPTGATAAPTASPADAPDYELLNIIGEGGMGVVYAARQSSIARTVALKMLKGDEGKNAAQREKFISEAVVTGELDHPNIVPIYDLGANNDGALFYSMKRVKGTPWSKILRSKSLDENLTILLRAADAVAFAHVNGVIHRDLKPENVMLGDFGEVLVMDWGLARVSPEFPNAASVSQSDAMGGTPAYMAPEMATGPLEKITTASDVYLLGAILYEIMTGRPPHSGKTVMACLFAAAKNKIEPTDRAGELFEIALKAMATEPHDRYDSVPAFQQAVREYQSHSQSIQLVESAQQHLATAAAGQDYEQYARALYGFEEALALWPGNRRATTLLARARLDYARLALTKGDYDLGASLLDSQNDDHREALAQLEAGRRERESRQRRIKVLKGAVAALVAAVVVIVSVAYAAVRSQRDEAVAQRERAETEKTRAIKAEGEAQQNAQRAEAAQKVAESQETLAKAETVRAVTAEGEAKTNLVEAQAQRERARSREERSRSSTPVGARSENRRGVRRLRRPHRPYEGENRRECVRPGGGTARPMPAGAAPLGVGPLELPVPIERPHLARRRPGRRRSLLPRRRALRHRRLGRQGHDLEPERRRARTPAFARPVRPRRGLRRHWRTARRRQQRRQRASLPRRRRRVDRQARRPFRRGAERPLLARRTMVALQRLRQHRAPVESRHRRDRASAARPQLVGVGRGVLARRPSDRHRGARRQSDRLATRRGRRAGRRRSSGRFCRSRRVRSTSRSGVRRPLRARRAARRHGRLRRPRSAVECR